MAVQPSIRVQVEANSRRRYALCGTRLYSVAMLDGQFPDMGWHQPGEMGGVWAPPLKLLDGYWLGLRELAPLAAPHAWAEVAEVLALQGQGTERGLGNVVWLTSAASWEIAPEGVTVSYPVPALGVQVRRREWIVPDESALVIEVTICEPDLDAAPRELECCFVVRSDLHGAWLAERHGWVDGEDVPAYDAALAAVIVRDALHPSWEVCVGASEEPVAWQVGNEVWGPERTGGRGTGAALWYRWRIMPGLPALLRFVIAGPGRDGQPASALFARLARIAERAFSENAHRRGPQRPPAEPINFPLQPSAASAVRPFSSPIADGSPDGSSPEDTEIEPGGTQGDMEDAHRRASEAFCVPFTQCVLQSPDPVLDEVFAWSKASTAWLMLDVPSVGRAVMAGLPDFPWWFGCDIAYGVLPMLAAGQTVAASASLRTLATIGQRSDAHGMVPHEVVSHGLAVFRGNLVEMPLFVRALYHTYRWTGDRALLTDLFPFCLRGLQDWLLGTCLEPGAEVPQGSSIVETPEMAAGLQVLDVAAYLVEALDLLAELASDMGQEDVAAGLRARAGRIRCHVRDAWWLPEERLFGDIYASRAELQALLRSLESREKRYPTQLTSIATLRRALAAAGEPQIASSGRRGGPLPQPSPPAGREPEAAHARLLLPPACGGTKGGGPLAGAARGNERSERGTDERSGSGTYPMGAGATARRPWFLGHMVQALAADAGLPDRDQATALLERLETHEWTAEFGLVLNAITNRKVMTLPTSALAAGEARYGRPDRALDAIRRMANAFGAAMPGTLSEYAPDGGCFLQLWSSYGIIWPIVHYFFGLRPDVAARRLVCAPQRPSAWPYARLSAVVVGSAQVSIVLTAMAEGLQVRLETTDPDWEVELGVVAPDGASISGATLNGAPVALRQAQLAAHEGREAWVAPAARGATSYELVTSWSGTNVV
jgi:hypothetical protein